MGTTDCKIAGMPECAGLSVPAPIPFNGGPKASTSTFALFPSKPPVDPGRLAIEAHESGDSGIGSSLRVLPSWLISMCLHVAVLVTLASVTGQVDIGTAISLIVGQDEPAELVDIDIALEPLPVDRVDSRKLEQQQNDLPDAAKLTMNVELSSQVDVPGLLSLQLDSELWGTTDGEGVSYLDIGKGLGELTEEGVEGDKAQFFGISARGSSFIFVIDCSGSMRGQRWISARNEVIRSMRSLKPDQQFCILLYSSFATAFEGNVNKAKYVAATPENLDLMTRWLNIQIPAGGTLPLAAVKVALELHPDAIFLLSDGELQDDTRGYLFKNNVRGKGEQEIVPIHTISAGMSMGAQLLEVISTENLGKFQLVW